MSLNKISLNAPAILVIAAFGPYLSLSMGIRLEHATLYPIAFVTFIMFILKPQIYIKHQLVILGLWGSMTMIFIIRSLPNLYENLSIFRFLSDTENFIQPLAILSLFLFLSKSEPISSYKKRIQQTFKFIVMMLCINTFWSLLNIFFDFTFINNLFWGGTESVSSRAITNGRFSGIFNQPMEAGVAYSLGLMVWLYLMHYKSKVTLLNISAMYLMIVGGLLTVSKIFLFGGIPIFIIGIVLIKNVRNILLRIIFISIITGTFLYYFFLKTWMGFDYLLRFFGSNQDFITLLSAGRFGEGSQQVDFFRIAWNDNWYLGQGFGAYEIYDSAYFNIFANGGTLGITFYILMLLILGMLAVLYTINLGLTPEVKLLIGVIILIVFAGIGAPVLTLNRVSILIWVTIGLLIQYVVLYKGCIKTNRSVI